MSTTTDETETDMLRQAREALAELTERRERLPRAICAACGGVVPAGSGRAFGKPDHAANVVDGERRKRMLTPIRGWTRWHEDCLDDVAVVRRLTGLRVSEEAAASAMARANPIFVESGLRPSATYAKHRSTTHDEYERWPGVRAWSHLSKEDRKSFAAVVRAAEHEHRLANEPHACTDGPCGSCGVRLSMGWTESPLRWKDGSAAPWCASCAAVADGRIDPGEDILRQRSIAIEQLSAASFLGIEHSTLAHNMRTFAELAEPGHPGTPERWEYAPEAWGGIRETARRSAPWSLPEPLRTEYTEVVMAERAEAAEAERREEERAEREAREAAGWPA